MPIQFTAFYVVTLQECLDTGYFTHRINLAKDFRPVLTFYVVAGIHRSDIAVFTVSPGARIGIITTTITTGTRLGRYLRVRAGRGKLIGTGDGVSTGLLVVLV